MMPALPDHLVQSTMFAALAGMLTMLLRNNHARTRRSTHKLKHVLPGMARAVAPNVETPGVGVFKAAAD